MQSNWILKLNCNYSCLTIWAHLKNVNFDTNNPRPEKFSETIIQCKKEIFGTEKNEFQAT